jgi:predicted TIM-barrel fold metal-dependent hydrolase
MITTPWGDLRVLDAHVHFFSHRFFQLLGAQNVPGWGMPAEDPLELAGQWVSELDRHGVERAALIASIPGDDTSVAAAIAAQPSRFLGYFMVNPLAPGVADTVEAAITAGLRGLCFFPAMHRYSMHDERAVALLEIAASRGCVAFVHCGVLSVGVRGKLGLPSPFDMRFSNPLDLHALALRYPRLPFVVPHFGAGLFREALMLCDLCPNVYLDTSSSNTWMKYQEPGCDLASVFRRALTVAGPGRLLFGTDSSFFPRGWHRAIFDAQVAALAGLGIDADAARGIFGGNLERILC